jgi:hypothetical protein
MMKTPLSNAVAGLCLSIAIVGTPLTTAGSQRHAETPQVRNQFVGSWRLVSLEHTGSDGKVQKADCTGQFVFTADGHAAVQVMYRNAGAVDPASSQYVQGGYEATFGRFTVDDRTHTFTFHVDGALVRTLVGQHLRRNYAFTGQQLIVEPVNTDEHWRVVWARD